MFTLRISPLLSSLNDAPVDTVDDEDSFKVSPKAEFISSSYVHITLATDTGAESLLTTATVLKTSWNSEYSNIC